MSTKYFGDAALDELTEARRVAEVRIDLVLRPELDDAATVRLHLEMDERFAFRPGKDFFYDESIRAAADRDDANPVAVDEDVGAMVVQCSAPAARWSSSL